MRKNGIVGALLLVFILLACIVLGSFVGELFVDLAAGNSSLSFLGFLGRGYEFGLMPPVTLDLIALTLTFGFTLKFSIMSVVFMVIGVVIYRKL